MSEFRFFAYTDFEFHTNGSQNLLNLPITPFHATKRTTSDEISHELNVPYTVFEILVAIFAVIGNLMVIIVFQRERKLRRRTNYYIVSLAMADFLVGSLGIPFAILASIGLPSNLHACLFTVSLLVVLCTTSIFGLVAVSVDRYWAILYPMAYSRNVRTKTAIVIISMCWVAGTVVGFLPLFGWHADVGPDQACLFVEVMDYDYLVFLYFATIITPALLMLAFYAHIYRVIVKQVRQIVTMNPMNDASRRSSTTQIHITATSRPCHGGTMLRVLGAARKRDVKATQNLSIIVLFFMICWIPLYTINCIKAFCPDCYVHPKLTLFCIILSHLNSAVNPVLYAYHLKDFRAALKSLLLKIMGVEIEQPFDVPHRYSLASQHRLQSIDSNMRHSLQPKIYIDSPIWLRQQQQQAMKNPQLAPKCGVMPPCLNNIHQTVAAVTSVTTDIERDMWNIMEASSNAEADEVNYEFPENKEETPTPPPRYHRRSLAKVNRSDSPYSYENRNYSTSPDEADFDEVFLPNAAEPGDVNKSQITSTMMEKLRSDDTEYQTKVCAKQSALTDSSYSDYEISPANKPSTTPTAATNGKLHHTIPAVPPRLSHQTSVSNTNLTSPSIYVIDDDLDPLTVAHKPKFKKSPRLTVNMAKATRSINRSCSCTSDSSASTRKDTQAQSDSNSSNSLSAIGDVALNNHNNNTHNTNNLNYYTYHHSNQHQQRSEKFSPLRAVSNFIFPPIVKHSSLFQLFQPHEHAASTVVSQPESATTVSTTNTERHTLTQRCSVDDSTITALTELEPGTPAIMTVNES